MAKEVETISIRAYAKKLGIDDKSIRNAIEVGKIKKGVHYVSKLVKGKIEKVPQIVEAVADREWGHLKKTPKPQAGVSKAKVAEKLDKKKVEQPATGKGGKGKAAPAKPDDEDGPVDVSDRTYTELLQMIRIDETLSYAEITRRREILGAAQDKMKLEQMQGILVEKAVIDKSLFDMGNRLKTNLLNIPSRVVALIRSSPNDVDAINILTTEINQVLEEMSTL